MTDPEPPAVAVVEVGVPDADRLNRIHRTDAQVLTGATFVTIAVWLLRLNGIDLNPLAGSAEIPAEVAAALGAVVSAGIARWMNRA